jgi:hypothetical protein
LDGGVNIAFETVSAAKQPPIATKTSQEENDEGLKLWSGRCRCRSACSWNFHAIEKERIVSR